MMSTKEKYYANNNDEVLIRNFWKFYLINFESFLQSRYDLRRVIIILKTHLLHLFSL